MIVLSGFFMSYLLKYPDMNPLYNAHGHYMLLLSNVQKSFCA